jgi:uncharacterized protein (TIGR00369 family)
MSVEPDQNTADRIRGSFEQQALMRTLGAEVLEVSSGRVVIGMPFNDAHTQQDGFLHAGAIASIADSACGYAAMTLTPADARVLSIEVKMNLLSPAVGERFTAEGRVVRSGKTISVCTAEVRAFESDNESEGKPVALMQATMMTIRSD